MFFRVFYVCERCGLSSHLIVSFYAPSKYYFILPYHRICHLFNFQLLIGYYSCLIFRPRYPQIRLQVRLVISVGSILGRVAPHRDRQNQDFSNSQALFLAATILSLKFLTFLLLSYWRLILLLVSPLLVSLHDASFNCGMDSTCMRSSLSASYSRRSLVLDECQGIWTDSALFKAFKLQQANNLI